MEVNILGTMTGTSLDGLDIALVKVAANEYVPVRSTTVEFAQPLRIALREMMTGKALTIEEMVLLEKEFSWFVAREILEFLGQDSAVVIGFPGQTICHCPERGFTWQLGSAGIVAAVTGITTVGDFRSQDVALGGEGAPLVPFVDRELFQGETPRVLLNIGGIANLTFLQQGQPVLAFDTGPGNMLIDGVAQKLFGKDFDDKGQLAQQGKVVPALLQELLEDEYFQRLPPKSTGQEKFGAVFLEKLWPKIANYQAEDVIRTVTALTVESVAQAVERFVPCSQGEVILSGGGACNSLLVEELQQRLAQWRFVAIDELALVTTANKEAVAFAILAYHALQRKINHLPEVTGASQDLVLGGIYWGSGKS